MRGDAGDGEEKAGGPYYAVKKGRKDSKVSLAGKVRGSLPRANSTVDELLRAFAGKGLGAADLVALSGAHTVGFAHCVHVLGRIYDFRGTRRPDPLMDARLVKALRMSCPSSGGSARVVVPFDVSTPFQFDHAYYANLQARLGLLGSDQALFLDPRTRPLVQELAGNKTRFFQAFVASMDRMGAIRIKKGRKGEVRKEVQSAEQSMCAITSWVQCNVGTSQVSESQSTMVVAHPWQDGQNGNPALPPVPAGGTKSQLTDPEMAPMVTGDINRQRPEEDGPGEQMEKLPQVGRKINGGSTRTRPCARLQARRTASPP
ncbi:peroxidase 19 [Panicum miliaceum]|uniref:Peroxidase n=1 Tax=Panicum miliaceum TaxID=4540 RepID=A0A3L6SM01_PANMI|nr:peroxidase 19 [Panicum miliaceum]